MLDRWFKSWPLTLTPTVTVRSGMSASSELSASAAGLNMPFRLTRWRQDRRLSLLSFGLAARLVVCSKPSLNRRGERHP